MGMCGIRALSMQSVQGACMGVSEILACAYGELRLGGGYVLCAYVCMNDKTKQSCKHKNICLFGTCRIFCD